MSNLVAEIYSGLAFVRGLNYELANAAMHPDQQVTIKVDSLRDLLAYLTRIYMPGEICDVIRAQYDCFRFTSTTPLEWPLPNVSFAVKNWDADADDVEVAGTIWVEQNLYRWMITEDDERSLLTALAWAALHGPWEDFDILKSFRIEAAT